MYHGFGTRRADRDPFNLFVPVADFDRHMAFVARYLRPLDLTGFLAGLAEGRWPARSCLVTIDDGLASTLHDAAPVLARRGVPAVAFVCPGLVGGTSRWMPEMPDEPLLDADGVRLLADEGVEVGVHGYDHTDLPALPAEELWRQVAQARDDVADLTGAVPRAFAYPRGLHDAAAVACVREAGYDVAFSVEEGSGRFAFPRRPVTARDSMRTFLTKLLPGFGALERLSAGHPRLRRAAARLAGQRPR